MLLTVFSSGTNLIGAFLTKRVTRWTDLERLALIEDNVSSTRLSVVILALGIVALGNGCLLTWLSARSVVAPVRSVRTR